MNPESYAVSRNYLVAEMGVGAKDIADAIERGAISYFFTKGARNTHVYVPLAEARRLWGIIPKAIERSKLKPVYILEKTSSFSRANNPVDVDKNTASNDERSTPKKNGHVWMTLQQMSLRSDFATPYFRQRIGEYVKNGGKIESRYSTKPNSIFKNPTEYKITPELAEYLGIDIGGNVKSALANENSVRRAIERQKIPVKIIKEKTSRGMTNVEYVGENGALFILEEIFKLDRATTSKDIGRLEAGILEGSFYNKGQKIKIYRLEDIIRVGLEQEHVKSPSSMQKDILFSALVKIYIPEIGSCPNRVLEVVKELIYDEVKVAKTAIYRNQDGKFYVRRGLEKYITDFFQKRGISETLREIVSETLH